MSQAIPTSSSELVLASYVSPIGRLTMAVGGGALVGLWAGGQRYFGRPAGVDEAGAASAPDLTIRGGRADALAGVARGDAESLAAAAAWLDDFFAGRRPSPASVRLAPTGSEFQLRVWEAMASIPYGTTLTYGRLAARLGGAGTPASPRAVGGAVARNPLLLIRPCHRVVAAAGAGGYAAGDEAKAWLLAHEAATASPIR